MSLRRLQSLIRRLKCDPTVLKEYDLIIRDQLQRKIIEVVPSHETAPTTIHYLPHHPVVRNDKTTTKVRVVYDASSKTLGHPSLNDCLLKGPLFDQLIFDILLRFRVFKIPLTADLEKAFLMISVNEVDRDVLRFLWVDDVTKDIPCIIAYRFTRVVFGISSSPFLLNATVRFHLERNATRNEEIINRLVRSTYVNDIITGAESEEEAFHMYCQAKEIFREGGFNMRKCRTSSSSLQTKINQREELVTQRPTDTQEIKVLGVRWNTAQDDFVLDFNNLITEATDARVTKRTVVRVVCGFYDPIGFAAPVMIQFKILFQELCRAKTGWDSPLPDELLSKWHTLVSSLQATPPIIIPRCYFSKLSTSSSCSLVGFCDASKATYAAIVYLLIKTDCEYATRFIACKTRVAPLKQQSIPRLELLSALLLTKLISSVQNALASELSLGQTHCYGDSEVTLYWIRGHEREWKPFVQNKVNKIRSVVSAEYWHYCSSVNNPADLPSRGIDPERLSKNKLWLHGPTWLQEGNISSGNATEMPEGCEVEEKTKTTHLLLAATAKNTSHIENLIPCQEYSNLKKLLRVSAHVIKAADLFIAKKTLPTVPVTLSPQELAKAESLWITAVQRELAQGKEFEQLKTQLGLFLDDKAIWRCGGRLQNSDLPYATKYPVLLSRGHPFTTLVIRDAHERVYHNGVKETLTEIRAKYWIVRGRSLVRTIIHKCVICRRYEGAPFTSPPAPPLPEFRVKEVPAFTNTGVDFAGPLFVKGPGSTKVWICLFTCLVTRAVHLDLVTDLLTETFIRCLRRFAARQGLPHLFLSDNGKTFKSAAKVIKSVFKDKTVKKFLVDHGCQWIFNVARVPWWGGVFERLIKSTKRCLRKVVGRASLTHDELLTLTVEIEAIINSRPLSYLSAADLEEPLTPSHLLVGRRLLNLPDHLGYVNTPTDEDFELTNEQMTGRVRFLVSTVNQFWERWRTEYLSELRECHHHSSQGTNSPSVSEGDIVIVHDADLPRGLWKLGCIKKLLIGRDGLARAAVVRVALRGKQSVELQRPLQLLYPLEVKCSAPSSEQHSDSGQSEVSHQNHTCEPERAPPDTQKPTKRPTRAAARRAAKKIQEQLRD